MHVDVITRLGVLGVATPTGFPSLDTVLHGGLRTGTLLGIVGAPGSGRTSLALLLAYMAARAHAAVLFASALLDETEVMARLAARALYREYPETQVSFGAIWSGEAWKDERLHAAVGTAVNAAVRKVGSNLHLLRLRPLETTSEIAAAAAHLWGRHERVVVVVDGLESLLSSQGGEAARHAAVNAELESRVLSVAYELRHLAESGCAVVCTAMTRSEGSLSGPCTLATELRELPRPRLELSARQRALGGREVSLHVTKNPKGITRSIPLIFVPGASLFEEPKLG